jgi:hypothetical protein
MYARPNVVYYAGLPQPYPYLWSLMVRVRPGARPRLQQLLSSARRPTWLVKWQAPASWNLDPDGKLERALASGYRLAAVVCTFPVYIRDDYPSPPPLTLAPCR